MGVRIDISMLAPKKGGAAVGVVAPKKAVAGVKKKGDAGEGEDFGQTLAKVQPKKKAAVTEQAAPAKAATPAAKGVAKKSVKAKGKDEAGDEVQAPAQDQIRDKGQAIADDADSVGEGDVVAGVEAVIADEQEQGGHEDSDVAEGQAAAVIEPTQAAVDPTAATVVAQAAVPQQPAVQQATARKEEVEAAPPAVGGTDASVVKNAEQAVKPVRVEAVSQDDEQGDAVGQSEKESENTPVMRDEKGVPKAAEGVETKSAVRHMERGRGEDLGQKADGGEVRAEAPEAPAAKAPQVERFNEVFQSVAERVGPADSDKGVGKAVAPADSMDAALTAVLNDSGGVKAGEAKQVQAAQPVPVAPEARFAEVNHPKVVTAVKTQLLPGGGAMQLRLDPPVLGPLRLEVRMEDGAMTASFVTANDQATSLLTHSLGQLKHALEGAGISVDKLQVRQGSAESFAENSDQRQQGGASDQSSARQEQERREMLNRMWQKVAGGDPLDLVA